MANQLAVNDPELKAAVAFYGRQPAAEEVKKIRCRVQLHYGSLWMKESMKAFLHTSRRLRMQV
jgi:dienelactone hydrolase